MARYGSPFTYAAESDEAAVAPGQISFKTLRDLYRYESIGPATPFYCVIGDPIGHSKSPLIHNAALAALGLDGCYVPFRVPTAELDRFLTEAREFGIRGVSITIPHKEASLTHATQLDPAAAAIGAVNTLVFAADGTTHGYNTDEPGAMESLEAALGEPLAGKRALVLGAGGAAKGIVYGLQRRGAATTVTNRNASAGRRTGRRRSGASRRCLGRSRATVPYDVLVNCTPLGMYPNVDDTPLPSHVASARRRGFRHGLQPGGNAIAARGQGARLPHGRRHRNVSPSGGVAVSLLHRSRSTARRDACRVARRVILRASARSCSSAIAAPARRPWPDCSPSGSAFVGSMPTWSWKPARANRSHRSLPTTASRRFVRWRLRYLPKRCKGSSLVIAAGGGVILRDDNRELLRRAGSVVWLEASPETLYERIQADKTTSARRPNLTAAGGLAEVREMLARREPLYRECAKLRIDADRQSPEAVVDAIVAAWQLPGERKHA